MNRPVLTTTLVAVAALALLSGFTRCGHRGPPDPERVARHIDHHVDDFIDDVDANDTQAQQIRALSQRVKVKVPGLMKGHLQLKKDLRDGWRSSAPDQKALHGELDAQLERFSSFAHELLDVGLELHEILTPEQRAEVSEDWD